MGTGLYSACVNWCQAWWLPPGVSGFRVSKESSRSTQWQQSKHSRILPGGKWVRAGQRARAIARARERTVWASTHFAQKTGFLCNLRMSSWLILIECCYGLKEEYLQSTCVSENWILVGGIVGVRRGYGTCWTQNFAERSTSVVPGLEGLQPHSTFC